MNEKTPYFLTIWSNKNVSNFGGQISKFNWFKKFDQINMTGY